MEDPDNSAQKPVATAGSRKSGVLKLPLANRCGPDKQPCSNDEGNKNPAKPRSRRQSLWYALYFPQLSELSESQQTQILTELAGLAENVSATVSFHSQALVCEIRSSLRYFGGIDNIHSRLQSLIVPALQNRSLGDSFLYAASPTVNGSLLLARSGHNALVYQKENLRSALGKLSVDVLDLQKEQRRRLHSMGVRKIRDIWRLPTEGLHKRFGSSFVNSLSKAVGKSPEPTRNYIPSPEFSASYDLPYEVENLHYLLPIIDEMLIKLRDFLIQRDLSTSRLQLSMIHEKRSRTEIDIGLRQATRQRDHLLLLIETHFAQLAVPAPVVGLKLEVRQFDAFLSESDALLTEEQIGHGSKINSKNLDQFMEQLHARLGDDVLKSINTVAEHCPEYATQQLNYTDRKATGKPAEVARNLRPFWLLDRPVQLTLRNGRLYHNQAINLISGPERIETSWWSGQEIRRDYYIAREQNGSRLWIFRERLEERQWYLHGYFS